MAESTLNTHALINRYYAEEREQQLLQRSLAELSVKMEANDLALVSCLAKRFSKSHEEIVRDVVSSALMDLFTGLVTGERKLLAREADDQAKTTANAIAEDNNLSEVEIKANYWTQADKAIVRQEKKRLKEATKEQAESSATDESKSPSVTEEVVAKPQTSETVTKEAAETQSSTTTDNEATNGVMATISTNSVFAES